MIKSDKWSPVSVLGTVMSCTDRVVGLGTCDWSQALEVIFSSLYSLMVAVYQSLWHLKQKSPDYRSFSSGCWKHRRYLFQFGKLFISNWVRCQILATVNWSTWVGGAFIWSLRIIIASAWGSGFLTNTLASLLWLQINGKGFTCKFRRRG